MASPSSPRVMLQFSSSDVPLAMWLPAPPYLIQPAKGDFVSATDSEGQEWEGVVRKRYMRSDGDVVLAVEVCSEEDA